MGRDRIKIQSRVEAISDLPVCFSKKELQAAIAVSYPTFRRMFTKEIVEGQLNENYDTWQKYRILPVNVCSKIKNYFLQAIAPAPKVGAVYKHNTGMLIKIEYNDEKKQWSKVAIVTNGEKEGTMTVPYNKINTDYSLSKA